MPYLIIAAGMSAVLVVIAIFAKVPTYHAAPAFLVPVLWAIYFLRRKLNLRPLHYALVASAILLHMLGAFGFYQKSPLPFSFDILVHFYFALVITPALFRMLEGNFEMRPWQVYVVTFFFMMGLAAMHEIMEYMSYLILGEQNGMLKPATSYFFDTQRDLTNNLLGTLTALAATAITRLAKETAKHPQHETVES
jgi:uncharacterized membrane protein YjdF